MISAIVPVYKVEAYLRQCVESILSQTFTDFELILVDDGSPDSCGELCDEYARTDARVTVLHRRNGGVSVARNAGIDEAKGDYIAFIDADDWCEPSLLEHLYNQVRETSAQIAVCAMCRDFVGSRSLYCVTPDRVLTARQAVRDLLRHEAITQGVFPKLFSRALFSDVRFPEGVKIAEDAATVFHLFTRADTVAYSSVPLYHYRQRQSSAYNSLDARSAQKNIEIIEEICAFVTRIYPDIPPSDVHYKLYRSYINMYDQLVEKAQKMRYAKGMKTYGRICLEDPALTHTERMKIRLLLTSEPLFAFLKKVKKRGGRQEMFP